MSTQNLIIYKITKLYQIFEELGLNLNFNILFADNHNSLNEVVNKSSSYLIISNENHIDSCNYFALENKPINIFKLVEKINIEFLKIQFNNQSEQRVNDYIIDFNSRDISFKNKKLKLTEKEISTIIYLSKSNKAISIVELQEKVWGYHSDIETHTVETHIYRLRKKILSTFKDDKFIISKKDGYQIK